MADTPVFIRPYQPSERPAALSLAPRLETGVASWRDAAAVRRAVAGWVRASRRTCGSPRRGRSPADADAAPR